MISYRDIVLLALVIIVLSLVISMMVIAMYVYLDVPFDYFSFMESVK